MKPLVSIIIPSYNQGKFIRETIDSILAQDYRPVEILVMDGGSNDGTLAVLESYGSIPELNWRSEPDKGVTDAVNKGLARAHGDIIAIQSSDDVYLPGAVAAVVDFMQQNEDAALVFGDVELMDEHSRLIGRDIQGPFDFNSYVGRFSYIPQPAAFFRAGAAREAGGWRAEVSYAADADFWLRIAAKQKVLKIDRVLGRYRYHSEQRDTQSARIARDWEKTVLDLVATHDIGAVAERYARMGIYLAKYRYAPTDAWFRRTCFLYRALLSNPPAVAHDHFPKRELLPGREPIWKILSHIKQALGFKPRIS